jgi:hypothetical protein
MKRFNQSRLLTIIFLLATFLFISIGCEKGSPLSTLDAEYQNQVMETNNNYGFKILKTKTQSFSKEFVAEQIISRRGGQIEVGDSLHGVSSLTFYPFSVTEDVLVSFWWESTGFLEGGSEFSPHGTQFFIPVKLELSYKDADLGDVNEDDLKIYYYHEDTGVWEALYSRVDKEAKTVTAYLRHFSRYAIGDTP